MKKRRAFIIITLMCALITASAGIAVMQIPSDSHPEERGALYYGKRGDSYFEDSEYSMALTCYNKALSMDDGNVDALLGAARSNSALGCPEEAAAFFEKLASLVPDDAELQLERVNTMIAAGYQEKAKDTLEELTSVFHNEKMDQLFQQMSVDVPQADLQSGSYDRYQRLCMSASNPNSAIYYTLDGSEPTASSLLYVNPLVISYPDTVLKAKCINYLGYESDTIELHYTITVPTEQILRYDYSAFTYAVREALHKRYNQPIYNYEAAQLTSLYIVGDGYYSYADSTLFYRDSFIPGNYNQNFSERGNCDLNNLKYTPFLETLAVCWQQDIAIAPISELQYLKNLSLLNDGISDISGLEGLASLEKLALGWNRIDNILPLKELKNLVSLGLWNNQIKDIEPLSQLSGLQYLDISNNQVTSLAPIAQLTNLEEFWANGNQITSIASLDPNNGLRVLMMSGNPLTDYLQWKKAHANLIRTDIMD